MPDDTAQPTPDAPQEPLQLQPGQSMINIGPEGMRIVTLPISQPITFGADKDLMRRMTQDWLHIDEQWWDMLVTERVKMLRENKAHLALVTDSATVAKISKSRTRGKA